MAIPTGINSASCVVLPGVHGFNLPFLIVLLISVVIGFLMVIVFRYTSDQKAIHKVKDQLKAHLLAVRLFQDQLPVVLKSYGRILRCTGRYLLLAFRPLLFVIIPMIVLIVQLDRYLGFAAVNSGQAFLVKAQASGVDALNDISLLLPPGMRTTAPAVHAPASHEVIWRVVADDGGAYDINVDIAGQKLAKTVVVSSGLARISPVRLREHFWQRMLESGESALPSNSPIESVEVSYPLRDISFLGYEWNWIWLFFVLSLAAGFAFKTVLGIEI
ncbi:MAG TPA: hypothetical protein VFA89_05320 [Terriglobales bacterium]|nr:hypothetical protein [Terriglobales bacterium]